AESTAIMRSLGANDVVFLIFHPDASGVGVRRGGLAGWSYVEDQAADVAQEFAADVGQVVVLAVEVLAIDQHSGDKTSGHVRHRHGGIQGFQYLLPHCRLIDEKLVTDLL